MGLSSMIPGLQGLLNYFAVERRQRDDRLDTALTAIYTAASETKIYIDRMKKSGRRSRKKEEELSRLWAKAVAPVRRFDRDLAERFLLKSDYWINPEHWTPSDIKDARIGIVQVCEEARGLLVRKGR